MEQKLQEASANTSSGELKIGSTAATLKGKALLQQVVGWPWQFALGPVPLAVLVNGNQRFFGNQALNMKKKRSLTIKATVNIIFANNLVENFIGGGFGKENDRCELETIAAGNQCTLEATFLPTEPKWYFGDLRLDVKEEGGVAEEKPTYLLSGKG